jgi:hypothetical protein
MNFGKALQKHVDEGAIQWKIGSVEKYCSVIAAKKFVERLQTDPLAASMREIVDGLAESKQSLERLGVSPPAEFNIHFHLKTGEVFVWFGDKHKLTWKQLMKAIDHVVSSCESEAQQRSRRTP